MEVDTGAEGVVRAIVQRPASLLESMFDPLAVRRLLQDLSLDQATFFGRYSATQSEVSDCAWTFLQQARVCDDVGVLVVVALFARTIELSSRLGRGDGPVTKADVESVRGMVGRHSVVIGRRLREIYSLTGQEPTDHGDFAFDKLDWDEIEFHQLGTTSLIFAISDSHMKYALKLTHILFTESVSPIASATIDYYSRWSSISRRCPWAVRIHGSGRGWILEDFVEGDTLREFIDNRLSVADRSKAGIQIVRDAFLAVIEAVRELHEVSYDHGHGDLNPSNIIIQRRSAAPAEISAKDGSLAYAARLIDMGKNILASTTVGRVKSADARFVAPEVLSSQISDFEVAREADYFSLGHLLAACLGFWETDGFYELDERLFADQPQFARIASLLVSGDPARRMAAFGSNATGEQSALGRVYAYTDSLATMLLNIDSDSLASSRTGSRIAVESLVGSWTYVRHSFDMLRATSGHREVISNYDILTSRRTIIAAISYVSGLLLLAYSASVDLGWDPIGIRNLGYHEHSASFNWQLRLVGGTFLVAGFQYIALAFGGVSFFYTCASRGTRVASEVCLWIIAVQVFVYVAICLLVDPRWWVACSGIGLAIVALNNVIAARARRQIVQTIRVDPTRETWYRTSGVVRGAKYDLLDYWRPTLLAFAATVCALAVAFGFHRAHDMLIYAIGISLINLYVFSYSQATRQGPILRANLVQHVVIGEILRTGA